LALGLLWAVLAGCDTGIVGGEDTNNPGTLPTGLISNNWTSTGGDGYEITGTTLKYYYSTPDDPYYMFYEGTIHSVTNFNTSSGVIIVEYTDGTYYDPDSNHFNATYYRDLSANSVQLAEAWDLSTSPASNAGTATLEEAKTKFTMGNEGNFVDWGNVLSYTK